MFVVQILVANIAVPLGLYLALTAAWLVGQRNRSPLGDSPEAASAVNDGDLGWRVAYAVLFGSSLYLAFALRGTWWPSWDEFWQRIPIAAGGIALAGILPLRAGGRGGSAALWAVRLAVVVGAGYLVFPSGPGWEFLASTRVPWLGAMALAAVVPWIVLSMVNRTVAGHLLLASLPAWAAAGFLTSQSFMKVTEPMLAVATLSGSAGLTLLCLRRVPPLAAGLGALHFVGAAAIAQAQFNSYLGLPDGCSWFAMLLPAGLAAMAALGCCMAGRWGQAATPGHGSVGREAGCHPRSEPTNKWLLIVIWLTSLAASAGLVWYVHASVEQMGGAV
ncbi:MAG: hypothetical protein D6753_01490 [Planctomycetota bacterium]|nr:MAG: hypothetical protein D6753_01490 [Planctomycetota bacterium]